MDDFKAWLAYPDLVALKARSLPQSQKSKFRLLNSIDPVFVRDRQRPHGRGPVPREFHYLGFSLDFIVEYENRFRPHNLRTDIGGAAFGTGSLATAELGKMSAFIRKTMFLAPDITAPKMRDACLAEFGEIINAGRIVNGTQPRVPMPPLRTFQSFMQHLRPQAEG